MNQSIDLCGPFLSQPHNSEIFSGKTYQGHYVSVNNPVYGENLVNR